MPYKRRKNYRKKRYNKKRKRSTKLVLYKQPFPNMRNVKFQYRYFGKFNIAGTGVTLNHFNISSPYDVDSTGVGSSCRFWDELMDLDMYNRYRVERIHYKAIFTNKSATDALVSVSLRNTTASFPLTGADLWYSGELPGVTVKAIMPLTGSNNMKTIQGSSLCSSIFSVPQSQFATDVDYTGGYISNPTKNAYLTIACSDSPSDAVGVDVECLLSIQLDTKIFGFARNAPQS